jgi:hypothetical protein
MMRRVVVVLLLSVVQAVVVAAIKFRKSHLWNLDTTQQHAYHKSAEAGEH